MKKVKVSVPDDHNIDERWTPVLMSFPHGAPPVQLLDAGSTSACSLTTHAALHKNRATSRRAVVLTTPAVRFIGTSELPGDVLSSSVSNSRKRPTHRDSSQRPCERYVIGQFNKTDNTLLLMEGGDIFEMQPFKRLSALEDDTADEKTRYEQRQLLTHQFGSLKRRRQMNAAVAAQISDTTHVVGNDDVVSRATKRINESAALQTAAQSVDKLAAAEARVDIPPLNPHTTLVEEVFTPRSVVPTELKPYLKQSVKNMSKLASKIATAQKANTSEWPEFVEQYGIVLCDALVRINGMKETSKSKESGDQPRLLKCCQLLVWYRKLYQARRELPRATALATDLDMNVTVCRLLLATFAQRAPPASRRGVDFLRTKPLRDKLVHYMLVVYLFLQEYQLPLHKLSSDLGIPLPTLKIHARAIGCLAKLEVSEVEKFDAQQFNPDLPAVIYKLHAPYKPPAIAKFRRSKK